MKGCYQDLQATARTIVDGWLRAGGLASKDEDGYVTTIVDRLKEVIKTMGLKVAPAEIEAAISYAASGMAGYKRLGRVTFVEAIPRSPSGKILRRLLKETLACQKGRTGTQDPLAAQFPAV